MERYELIYDTDDCTNIREEVEVDGHIGLRKLIEKYKESGCYNIDAAFIESYDISEDKVTVTFLGENEAEEPTEAEQRRDDARDELVRLFGKKEKLVVPDMCLNNMIGADNDKIGYIKVFADGIDITRQIADLTERYCTIDGCILTKGRDRNIMMHDIAWDIFNNTCESGIIFAIDDYTDDPLWNDITEKSKKHNITRE